MSVQELWLKRGEYRIFGHFYLPEKGGTPYPLLIMAHGFGVTHGNMHFYAKAACQAGYAVYSFDFCGGSLQSKSDGDFTEMSVLTEAKDLEAVMEQLKLRDDIDRQRIYLVGESQGAFVSAYLAGKIPNQIAGVVLMYPAFVLQDDAAARVKKFGSGPDVDRVFGDTVIGRIYTIDAISFDIYHVIRAYQKTVLLIHGDKDTIVPISYSEKALEVYNKAELLVIPGANHGFYGEDIQIATQAMLTYLAHE